MERGILDGVTYTALRGGGIMQRSNYVTNSSLCFQIFTQQQCEEIHSATLEVLERVGVNVHHPKALEILAKGGAYVVGNRVKYPAALVERCIRSTPSRVVLCNRNQERKMFLEGNNFYFGPGPSAMYTLDPLTGERRFPILKDTCNASRVMDALPNIDFQMDFGTISDVDDKIPDVFSFEALLSNSTKPIVHWSYNTGNLKAIVDMAVTIAGSLQELQNYPLFALYCEPISPLTLGFEALDIAMAMAEYNLPIVYTPAPQGGITAPATLAGTIVQALAESLSGLVLHQLVREGAPFIMGGVITIMDMSATQITYASPEFNLMSAGLSSMAKYYKIPVFSTAGCSDSKCVDQQAGIDIATSCMMAALSGGNLIHDVGYMESGMATSLQSLVIADEVIGQVKRLIRGIEVNKETLALDVIASVGPGGHYLAETHTRNNFKKEWWMPTIFNRGRHANWSAEGKPDLLAVANRKLKNILENYQPDPLDEQKKSKLREIVSKM